VAAFRPVEMVTLRRPGSNRLRYAGAATFWDPPAADREVMRDLARRVGEGLRRRVGYRGAFTVDGVLAVEGFPPTELNPRLGAGLSMMTRDLPDLPVGLLDRALIEGEALAFAAADLERQVLRAADRSRAGGAWTVTDVATDATRELPVRFEDGACRPADGACRPADGDRPADGALSFGPSGVGGFARWPSTRTGCRWDGRWRRSPWPRSPWPTSGSAPGSDRWSRPGRSADRATRPGIRARRRDRRAGTARRPGVCLGRPPAGTARAG
jgi:hypothetical protein